jgi:hypothetical protein
MKKTIQKTALSLLLFASITSYGQVIFSQNNDKFALGAYTLPQLLTDYVTTSGQGFVRKGVGEDRVTVESTGLSKPGGRCLKVKYPKGGYDSKPSGAQWVTDLKANYEELYLSYYVKFGSNFSFDKIGKLPGLAGGLDYNDQERSTEWSGKLMWRIGGLAQFYLHQPVTNEKQYFWGINGSKPAFTTNKWYHIEIHYKLNTVGSANGIMEAWLNGVLVSKYTNIQFRSNSKVGINKFFFSTFFGGGSESAPNHDDYSWFDEFIVSKSRIGYTARYSNSENVGNEQKSITSIYPVPVTDNVLNISGLAQEKSQINIYNISGVSLLQSEANSNQSKIDVSKLSVGTYVVVITGKNGSESKIFNKL